mmetsp:Transcript_15485/g.41582  ORF Transcript_15485/g.41582 Transcript_15485/m.41582 type:complete len:225 (+) Transcript_15485:479-1153(+)
MGPRADGPAHGLCHALMSSPHIVHTFLLEKHDEGLAQTVQHRNAWRVREVADLVVVELVAPGEEHARQRRPIDVVRILLPIKRVFESRGSSAHKAEAGREHETLLRACYGNIDAPGVHVEFDRADRGHTVYQKHCIVFERIEHLAHSVHVCVHASGGLVLHDAHCFDVRVLPQLGLHSLVREPFAPLDVQSNGPQPEPRHHIDPQVRKLAEPYREHLVPTTKRV